MGLSITPRKRNGNPNGFWVVHYVTGHISYKCYWVNGEVMGYLEDYHFNGSKVTEVILTRKEFYIR